MLSVRGLRILSAAFFCALALIGAATFRDYGLPYDEGVMDSLGHDAYRYVRGEAPWPDDPQWRYHGTFVELPLYALQEALGLRDDPPQFNNRKVYVRHAVSFAFYLLAVFAVYLVAMLHTRHRGWSLLAALVFVLLPRIYAHGFYNSRDVPQIALFTLAIAALLHLLEGPNLRRSIMLGVCIASALSLRMTALILLPLTWLFLAADAWRSPSDRWSGRIVAAAVTSVAAAVLTVVFWPFLWASPLTHFLEAYRFMSTLAQGETFFLGSMHDGVPWYYIPVWMSVTIPPIFLAFALLGTARAIVVPITERRACSASSRTELLFAAWLLLPIAAVVATGAGLYLEWRHVFFIAPAVALLAMTGLRSAVCSPRMRKSVWAVVMSGAVAAQCASTAAWMVRHHPHQHLYYSIPMHVAVGTFLGDYWALSYKQSAGALLALRRHERITAYSDENNAFYNLYTFYPEAIGTVLRAVDINDAMYVLTRSPELAKSLRALHEERVDGVVISGVYAGPRYPAD